jgi:nucleoside-diphosphate-sugar epimerase
MTRVLVTGGTGYVGTWIVRGLRDRGCEVIVAGRHEPLTLEGSRFMSVDLLDHAGHRRLIDAAEPDVLVHAAWTTEHGIYWASPANLPWVGASASLLHAFQEGGGSRFIGVGSCAEYSWPYDKGEAGSGRPSSFYGVSKRALGEVSLRFAAEAGISAAWARVFFSFGPGEDRRRLVPRLIDDLSAGRDVVVQNPQAVRDFLPVQMIGDALAAVTVSPVTGVVDVGSGTGVRLGDLARWLGESLNAAQHVILGDAADAEPAVVADVTALRTIDGLERPLAPDGWRALLLTAAHDA